MRDSQKMRFAEKGYFYCVLSKTQQLQKKRGARYTKTDHFPNIVGCWSRCTTDFLVWVLCCMFCFGCVVFVCCVSVLV